MNKIYFIERTDTWGYNEYNSCVVIAKDTNQAEQLINIKGGVEEYYDNGQHTIEVIGTSYEEPRIVISSFNAG